MNTVSSMSNMARLTEEKVTGLTSRFGPMALVPLVLDAASAGEAFPPCSAGREWEVNPNTLLTALTYCYGVGLYSPEEIEEAIHKHPAVGYLAARAGLSARVIRRFRREHRALLSKSLARFFESVWMADLPEAVMGPLNWPGLTALEPVSAALKLECARLAEDHILLALLWDGPAMRD